MKGTYWYCVEIDVDGNVQRCERVTTKPQTPGCGVIYVLADDEGSAKKKALAVRITRRSPRAR